MRSHNTRAHTRTHTHAHTHTHTHTCTHTHTHTRTHTHTQILVCATQYVVVAERESVPDKSKVLHDYLQCELALQEAKFRLVTVCVCMYVD